MMVNLTNGRQMKDIIMACLYNLEFQKRGLSHIHIIFFIDDQTTREQDLTVNIHSPFIM